VWHKSVSEGRYEIYDASSSSKPTTEKLITMLEKLWQIFCSNQGIIIRVTAE
jgi:hypothetical protein